MSDGSRDISEMQLQEILKRMSQKSVKKPIQRKSSKNSKHSR